MPSRCANHLTSSDIALTVIPPRSVLPGALWPHVRWVLQVARTIHFMRVADRKHSVWTTQLWNGWPQGESWWLCRQAQLATARATSESGRVSSWTPLAPSRCWSKQRVRVSPGYSLAGLPEHQITCSAHHRSPSRPAQNSTSALGDCGRLGPGAPAVATLKQVG